jgi:hypothetical protein
MNLRTSVALLSCLIATGASAGGPPTTPYPILFVTQFPVARDFATIGSTFANHEGHVQEAGRGGDLFLRYPDGTLRNLTQEAGYGETDTFQGPDSISVRDPHVHWEGTRALFSMVIGATPTQYQWIQTFWQVYEVTGLGVGGSAVITKVPNQPEDFNNITPIYSPDGRIVFSSDRPRNGAAHLYPQHDEYESTATNTGLWALDPATGELDILNHAPSGSFTPIVDSYGRIVFTRWDHLQQDQQAEAGTYGNFDWADESAAAPTSAPVDVFPEPRQTDPIAGTNGFTINHFFPWQIHPDGTAEETLNHIGRHELHSYFNSSFYGDPDLEEFIASTSGRVNPNSILSFFQIAEDPTAPGTYYGVDAPEFYTHASGRIVSIEGPPELSADQMVITYVTHPITNTTVPDGSPTPPGHSGHYREPLRLSDGSLLAVHTPEVRAAANDGTTENPDPRYDFRIKRLDFQAPYFQAGQALLPGNGIERSVQFWSPDVLVSYTGPMWELSPVEVRPRPAPPNPTSLLEAPEQQVFAEEGVDLAAFRAYLANNQLALIVSRNVTTRDALDTQQPYNLRVPGGAITTGNAGLVYDISHLQLYQGDQLRGIGGVSSPTPGRRVLARPLHDENVDNPPTSGPEASVELGMDGSMAAFVPADRALSWQLTAPDGTPVVRERYWLTFQAGEIRVCASCHGINALDQAGATPPTNPPEALRTLLQYWSTGQTGALFGDGFETGDTSSWTSSVP